MGQAFLYGNGGGSGAGGNVRVKAYATEAALNADTPADNTVGIITETAIGAWQFFAGTPITRADGTALEEGDVWIKISGSSSAGLSVLKGKNGAWVYPNSCYQYISGAWTVKTAKTRIINAWVAWEFYPYYFGQENVPWSVSGAFVKNANNVSITRVNYWSYFYTDDLVNLTNVSSIKLSGNITETFGNTYLEAVTVRGTDVNAVASVAASQYPIILDVSSVTGEYYLQARSYNARHRIDSAQVLY